jgi:AcrR family transcriptional regulator
VGRLRLKTDQRREQLLRAGIELVGSMPADALSMGAIARAAGVSKALLYHYFRDKEEYFIAVVNVVGRELAEVTEPDHTLPLKERFERAVDGFVTYAENHASGYIVIFRGHLAVPGVADAIKVWRDRRISGFVEQIAQLTAADPEVVRGSRVLKIVIDGQITSLETSVLHWLEHRDLDRAKLIEVLAGVFLMAMVAVHGVEPELRLDTIGTP